MSYITTICLSITLTPLSQFSDSSEIPLEIVQFFKPSNLILTRKNSFFFAFFCINYLFYLHRLQVHTMPTKIHGIK